MEKTVKPKKKQKNIMLASMLPKMFYMISQVKI